MKKATFLLNTFLLLATFLACSNSIANETNNIIQSDYTDTLDRSNIKILSEKNHIRIHGAKSSLIHIQIIKKSKIKILTKKGLKYFEKISLPESFDSSFIRHSPKARNHQGLYSDIKIDYFEAEVIHEDKTRSSLKVKSKIETVKTTMRNDRYGENKRLNYQIQNLKVGDEVEIRYSYTIPYNDNFLDFLSFRIFFNGTIYKENYELIVSHKIGLKVSFFEYNEAKADSIFTVNKTRFYKWKRKKLDGNLLETGSRPYLSLPYLILSIKPLAYSYNIPGSLKTELLPTYVLFSAYREFKHLSIVRSIDQGLKLKQFILIDQFIEEIVAKADINIYYDSSLFETLKQITNLIANDFTYLNDKRYFQGWDNRDPRIGSHIVQKKIREISRYETLIAIIRKLKLNYYTVYPPDIRSGNSDNDLSSMKENDYLLLAISRDQKHQYIYPKTSNFGFLMNEYPFYYENVEARLIHLADYMNNDEGIKKEVRTILIPASNYNDNYRRSNILVEVDLSKDEAIFKSKVDLSGQYSTMTRGIYKSDYKDPTVNELYSKKIWDISPDVEVIDSSLTIKNDEFPFNSALQAQYKLDNLYNKKNDTLIISLSGFIRHIISDNINTDHRTLDYYPDFLGYDLYNYVFKFNKNIKLLNSPTDIKVKNNFGDYQFSISQLSENSIKVSSFLSITNDKIEAMNIQQVEDIFSKIINNEKANFQFTLER